MIMLLNLASVASSMEGPTFSKAASKSAESSLSLSPKMALRAASRNCWGGAWGFQFCHFYSSIAIRRRLNFWRYVQWISDFILTFRCYHKIRLPLYHNEPKCTKRQANVLKSKFAKTELSIHMSLHEKVHTVSIEIHIYPSQAFEVRSGEWFRPLSDVLEAHFLVQRGALC